PAPGRRSPSLHDALPIYTGTAWCCAPCRSGAGGPGGADGSHGAANYGASNYGASNYTVAELDDLVSRAVRNGVEVSTRAIGDARSEEHTSAPQSREKLVC